MKLKPVVDDEGSTRGWAFFCPGCEHVHAFFTLGPTTWAFDGDQASPTFSPSLLNTSPGNPDPKQIKCHLSLIEGKLHFHGDCSHGLAGKVVVLADWPWETGSP
jgi:hypothetical protein